MLDVVLYRLNEMEIYDPDLQKEAELRRGWIISLGIISIFSILAAILFPILIPEPSPLITVLRTLFLLILLIFCTIGIWDNIYELRFTDLSALKLYFKKAEVERLVTLKRTSITSNTYFENEIRVNQAIGIRIVEEYHRIHNSFLWKIKSRLTNLETYFFGYVVEIIYDTKADGVAIFKSYDPETIQELQMSLSKLIPNLKIVEYMICEKESLSEKRNYFEYQNMEEEGIQEFNDPRVVLPKTVRDFLKEKYKIL